MFVSGWLSLPDWTKEQSQRESTIVHLGSAGPRNRALGSTPIFIPGFVEFEWNLKLPFKYAFTGRFIS